MANVQTFLESHPELLGEMEKKFPADSASVSLDDVIATAQELDIDTAALEDVEEGELSEEELMAVSGGVEARFCLGYGVIVKF